MSKEQVPYSKQPNHQKLASSMWNSIARYQGHARVLDTGTVLTPHVEVDIVNPIENVELCRTLLRREVRQAELNKGVIYLRSGDEQQGRFRNVVVDYKNKIRIVNTDRGVGKTIYDTTLDTNEKFALSAAVNLVSIPLLITKEFTTFENFLHYLSKDERTRVRTLMVKNLAAPLYREGINKMINNLTSKDPYHRKTASVAQNFLSPVAKMLN